jgi:putative transposase
MATATKPNRARKRKKDAPTHVIQVCLRSSPAQRSVVDTRFEAGRRFYNAVLGEAIRRCDEVHHDPDFAVAKALPRGAPRSPESVARRAAFAAINERHGFSKFSLQSYGDTIRQSWVREHVLVHEAATLSNQAFRASERWSLGLGGKPRFKPAHKGLRSMSGKDAGSAPQPVVVDGHITTVRWGKGFFMPVAPTDATDAAERARLEQLLIDGRYISTRIVRASVRGRYTYRAHFTIDGPALVRHPVGTGTVSLDLGPSKAAVVTVDEDGRPVSGEIRLLADGIVSKAKDLSRRQRRLDRQHRTGSPDCFDERGSHRTGGCAWRDSMSKRAKMTGDDVRELHRTIAAHRASLHGALTNELLADGVNVKAEHLNYAAWQKQWPRSVKNRAPGMMMAELFRKAENAGGTVHRINTWSTALSQTCVCGRRKKKPLSQRVHRCVCGVVADRDPFSAFLGLFVHPVVDPETGKVTDLLDLEAANEAYPRFAPHLHDSEGASRSPSLEGETGKKHRGQGRPSGRSMARIKARRMRRALCDRGAGVEPGTYIDTELLAA